jgi:hypothetical protein
MGNDIETLNTEMSLYGDIKTRRTKWQPDLDPKALKV